MGRIRILADGSFPQWNKPVGRLFSWATQSQARSVFENDLLPEGEQSEALCKWTPEKNS